MNRNLNRRIHPIAEADGLSPKKHRKVHYSPQKQEQRRGYKKSYSLRQTNFAIGVWL